MFNVTIINPPYERNLHFSFLRKAIEHSSDYALTIEPCNWLILPYKSKVSSQSDKGKCIEYVEKYKSDIEVIQGMEYFDAYIAPKLSINLINKKEESNIINVTTDNGTKTYNKVDDILLYGNDSVTMSIRQKLIGYIEHPEEYDTLADHIRLNPQAKVGFSGKQDRKVNPDTEDVSQWWCVNLAIVRGNTNKITGERGREFYTWLPYKRTPEKYSKENKLCMLPFNTKEEAENCIDYLKSDFARFVQYLVKTDYNQNQCMYRLPWLDFSKKWTDKEINDKFGLTDEEVAHMREILPDYHARYTTGVTITKIEQESMIEEEEDNSRIDRREHTGEVFTPKILVDKMLNKLPTYLFDGEHTFLDNSAGNGNFIIGVLERLLSNNIPWDKALSCIYATELMPDNTIDIKHRIYNIIKRIPDYDAFKASEIINYNIINTDMFNWDYEYWTSKVLSI